MVAGDVILAGDALKGCAKAGWLKKLGEQTMIKRWIPRFVVLSGALVYYYSGGEESSAPKGIINLEGSSVRPSTRASESERKLVSVRAATSASRPTGSNVWAALDAAAADAKASETSSPAASPAPSPGEGGGPSPMEAAAAPTGGATPPDGADAGTAASASPAGSPAGSVAGGDDAPGGSGPMVPRAFEVMTCRGRRFHFCCDTAADALAWIAGMRSAARVDVILPGWEGAVDPAMEVLAARQSAADDDGLRAVAVVEEAELAAAMAASQADAAAGAEAGSSEVGRMPAEAPGDDVGGFHGGGEVGWGGDEEDDEEDEEEDDEEDEDGAGAGLRLSGEARAALLAAPASLQTAWAILESRAAAAAEPEEPAAGGASPPASPPASARSSPPPPPTRSPSSRPDASAAQAAAALESLRRELTAVRRQRRELSARCAALTGERDSLREACEEEAEAREEAEAMVGVGGGGEGVSPSQLRAAVEAAEARWLEEEAGRVTAAVAGAEARWGEAEAERAAAAVAAAEARWREEEAERLTAAVAEAEAEAEARAERVVRAQTAAMAASASGRAAVEASLRGSSLALLEQVVEERDRAWRAACRRGIARLRDRVAGRPADAADATSEAGSDVSVGSAGAGRRRASLGGAYLEALQFMAAGVPSVSAALEAANAKGLAAGAVDGARSALASAEQPVSEVGDAPWDAASSAAPGEAGGPADLTAWDGGEEGAPPDLPPRDE